MPDTVKLPRARPPGAADTMRTAMENAVTQSLVESTGGVNMSGDGDEP